MTRETLKRANGIAADLESLKNIKTEYRENHLVSFYGAVVNDQPISGFGILRKDLEKFIDDEIVKLENELEKL